ncbi:MAG TPA: class I SAM-dependent methyltransferase [Ktedonobacterales bacterium]
MRLGIIPQNPLDWLALASGRVPEPIIEAFLPIVLARSIMAATTLGIFPALAAGPLSADAVAQTLNTDPRATATLLGTLESAGYLRERGGNYALTRKSRVWLLPSGASDVSPYIRFNYLQWDWMSQLERFVRTGAPIDFHETLAPDQWRDYEQGMVAIARQTLPEIVWRVAIPAQATTLLDIGGGHGLAAARFCQRHPGLHATVLDLPQALGARLTFPPDIAARVTWREGDALSSDLGCETFDVIYVANLLHHFDATQITGVASRIAAALRPGGVWVIQDAVRERRGRSQRMAAALGDLYFALTSASGLWSFEEMAEWQRSAGLDPMRPIRLLTAPGQGLQIGKKPEL